MLLLLVLLLVQFLLAKRLGVGSCFIGLMTKHKQFTRANTFFYGAVVLPSFPACLVNNIFECCAVGNSSVNRLNLSQPLNVRAAQGQA